MEKITDFSWVSWKISDIKRLKNEYILTIKDNKKKLLSIPQKDRFFQVVIPFYINNIAGDLHSFPEKIHFLMNISPDKELRKFCSEVENSIQSEIVDIFHDPLLLEFFESVIVPKDIDLIDKKLLEDIIRGLKRKGFEKSKIDQEKIKKIQKELSKLSTVFQNNLANFQKKIFVSEKDIATLPESYKSILKKTTKGFEINTETSIANPFIRYSENEKKVKQLFDLTDQKGGNKNLKILQKTITLRENLSKLLGYSNFAQYILEDRMAKKPDIVKKFLLDLNKSFRKFAITDIKKVQKISKQKDLLSYWQLPRYFRLYQELQGVDIGSQKLKEYFILNNVLVTMFALFEKLFSIKIEKDTTIKLWHSSILHFGIFDKKTNQKLGSLLFDLFPRDGKYKHAAAFNISAPRVQNGIQELPILSIVANFTQESKDIPSLLTFGEVETLFHEFGHALHYILSGSVKYMCHTGFDTCWDFVEVPSQLAEEWLWDESIIYSMSKHYKTEKKLDKTEIKKIIKSRFLLEGYMKYRQSILALFDFYLHTNSLKKQDLPTEFKKMLQDLPIHLSDVSIFPAGFGHIMGGYAAGYYSYLWSEVLSVDIFSEFEKRGKFNQRLGYKLRKELLSVGSSRDENVSVASFLERKPNQKSLIERIKKQY